MATVLALVLGPAAAASADPARPTDYRSRILSTSPALPAGVDLTVAGGDAFLDLRVARGHTAVVPDYDQGADTTPVDYLRVGADGIVERNANSFAATLNESRYGSDPGDTDPDAEPRWEVVARDGRYVWHDHRIHWMLPGRPSAVADDGRVDLGGPEGTWELALTVDGEPHVVQGELLLLASPTPIPWFALIAVALLAVLVPTLLRTRAGRPAPHRPLAGALVAVAALATVAGAAQWRSIPPGAGGDPLTAVVPAVALAAALAALALRPARFRLVALALATAALGGWALLRREVLLRAVLPTSLPFPVDRFATALALGLAAGTAVLLVWRPPVDPPIPPA